MSRQSNELRTEVIVLLLYTCSLKGDKKDSQQKTREEIATLGINRGMFCCTALWTFCLEDEAGFGCCSGANTLLLKVWRWEQRSWPCGRH